MNLTFYKYQGAGNDFVVVDNRKDPVQLSTSQVKHLCERKFGIGADGLMLLNNHAQYDFEMVYYNADGKEGTMCGNGGRCLVKFAHQVGIRKGKYSFIATDGPHEATIEDNGWVYLKMKDVNGVRHQFGNFILNTGSPHYVKPVQDILNYKVVEAGKSIRYSDEFAAEGININFVEEMADKSIYVRTYERGVEDETLSCGTGVTASALMYAHNDNGFNRVEVQTLGGKLAVEFSKKSDEEFTDIWLCGPAQMVYQGTVEI